VVAEAEDGKDAIELCRHLRPDLVLMDVRMPGVDGLEATRVLKKEFPKIRVLVMTAFTDPGYLVEALRAGAAGYVLKTASGPQIADTIRRVLDGEHVLDQEVAYRLLLRLVEEKESQEDLPASVAGRTSERCSPEPDLLELLTPREIEVLRLIALGQTNQQIAGNLLISYSSVKKHVRRIISKLEVSDRVQAAIRAHELGLLPKRDG